MSGPVIEAAGSQELAPASEAPVLASAPAPQPLAQAHPRVLPATPPAVSSALGKVQLYASRALAETAYQLRRLGLATLAGVAAVVLAATLFIANNLPQGNAVAALKNQLVQLAPLARGGAAAAPGGVILAALPSRGEAPNVVAKILEEARASGVELPRGQYEYVPARDGVAARYRMTFPVHASYPKIREFMDRTLVVLPAVAVEGLRIERKNVGDDSVDAELKLSAYVRSEE
jgi:hypothetical protein